MARNDDLASELAAIKSSLSDMAESVADMHLVQAQVIGSIILSTRIDGGIDTKQIVGVLEDGEGDPNLSAANKALLAEIRRIATGEPLRGGPDRS